MNKIVLSNTAGTMHESFSIGKRGITIYQSFNVDDVGTAAKIGDFHVHKGDGKCHSYTASGWVELQQKKIVQNVTTSNHDILPVNGYIGCIYTGEISLFLPPGEESMEITIKDQTTTRSALYPINIYPFGDDTIDGQLSYQITSPYKSVKLIYNNNWFII